MLYRYNLARQLPSNNKISQSSFVRSINKVWQRLHLWHTLGYMLLYSVYIAALLCMLLCVVLTMKRSFYPTKSVHSGSVLIIYHI